MLHAVIMAGGSGTRFWPQSRRTNPKQLLRLAGERTMIQDTVGRCTDWIPAERTWVVTNESQANETRRQLPSLPEANVLIEPCGRNTAPCIGLAATRLLDQDPDAVMFVMPADHVIRPVAEFQAAGRRAASLIEHDPGQLVLFGIRPTYSATGYGYIQRGAGIDSAESTYRVASFREKPDRETAEQYVESGSYYWNCGIFCWQAKTIMELLARFEPELDARLQRISIAAGTDDQDAVLAAEFPQMKSISIDYAVLERAIDVVVVEAPFTWDDVGSWLALPRLSGSNADGNTLDGPYCGVRSKNCIIRTTGEHLVATVGVDDLVIVHTPDATLVAHRDDADAIRDLVTRIAESGLDQYL